MFWSKNREQKAAGSHQKPNPRPESSCNVLLLSYNNQTATSPPNPLYLPHRWYRILQSHTWQLLIMCCQNPLEVIWKIFSVRRKPLLNPDNLYCRLFHFPLLWLYSQLKLEFLRILSKPTHNGFSPDGVAAGCTTEALRSPMQYIVEKWRLVVIYSFKVEHWWLKSVRFPVTTGFFVSLFLAHKIKMFQLKQKFFSTQLQRLHFVNTYVWYRIAA